MINPIPPTIPTIGQRDAALKASVQQGLHQIATQIYTQLAANTYPHGGELPQIAHYAMNAARNYFEALGIATFENTP